MGTFVKLGFREAIGVKNDDQHERDLAAQVLSLLADRRVLFALYEYEVPKYCLESVQTIRARLTELRGVAHGYTQLADRLRAMLKACQIFVEEAGPLISEEPLFRLGNEDNVQRIITALGGLRKAFGLHGLQISVLYGLTIDDDLMSIVPKDDG